MDQLKVIQFFQENYNLFTEKLTEIQSGMVGDSFLAETKDEKYFLKIYGTSRLAEISKQNIKFYTKCLESLEKNHLRIPRIIKNNGNNLVSDFYGNPFIVFNFIEKDKSNIPNFEKEVKLAKTFAEIHKIKLEQNVDRKETFKPHFSQNLFKWIDELKQTHEKNIFTNKLWELIKPIENDIKNKIKELENISIQCQKLPQNFVFCNTDPVGDNVIISNNECFLVDWDGAMFAPAEHDIWFYLENKDFFEEYKKNYPEIQVFKGNIAYYMYFRILEDLADWIYRIMYEKQSDEENEKDLLDLQTDCLIELKNMEEKIEKRYKTTLI